MSSGIQGQETEGYGQDIINEDVTTARHQQNDIWQLINSPSRGRTPSRRCISCVEPSNKARNWFSSPDRFLASRAGSTERESVFRASKSPHNLSPREKHSRQRDPNADPFHLTSPSRSRAAIRIRRSSPGGRQRPPHFTPSFVHGHDASPSPIDANPSPNTSRQISAGAVWNVGGPSIAQGGPRPSVHDGHGGLLASGTNSPIHIAHFLDRNDSNCDVQQHENRLALALDIDQASRVLNSISRPPLLESAMIDAPQRLPFTWKNSSWAREEGCDPGQKKRSKSPMRSIPTLPFRVLDAPRLRDDFYCSTLAYSHTCRTLAVGLSSRVYLWTEDLGVRFPPLVSHRPGSHVTCLSFSSEEGKKAILAVGRQSGLVSFVSPAGDGRSRLQVQKSSPVSCLAFKPTVSLRPSRFLSGLIAACEDLLVGDDVGDLHYYSIEWLDATSLPSMPEGLGQIVQLAKVAAHSQQICGLAWSPDGRYFATGGNDNGALFFEVAKVLPDEAPGQGRSPLRTQPRALDPSSLPFRPNQEPGPHLPSPPMSPDRRDVIGHISPLGRGSISPSLIPAHVTIDPTPRTPSAPVLLTSTTNQTQTPPASPTHHRPPPPQPLTNRRIISQPSLTQHFASSPPPTARPTPLNPPPGLQTHTLPHSAAVKAIAFAPWQPSLLATGGGSNDRQIHFFHTGSGATLALINVFAQVTSLIWSKTKRELCATFGYAQPEHGIRIAVFAWPSGECVVSIPWAANTSARNAAQAEGARVSKQYK
ncbi:hypothetical protein EPUS_07355 [Endocarpon pusillum Z07020]|uniref:Uncharacterized protein n=1 Tax=Endocarpon pusillum (strain Z07020 / HMAS-L-300199) TaxID=1263415 RepID=U1GEH5_ENDPU|nr:uncharacterized protein EPUS_07355 [Endocarpon pusillum Z07020]ERF70498.1 hypothetical protein EPUS_07355 [Endocarpon pusillum Z07020]